DLLVVDREILSDEATNLGGEQLILEGVQSALTLTVPPAGVRLRDLVGEPAGEDGVARIRRRGRQDRVVQRLLNLREVREDRQDRAPLVEAEAIHDHEEDAPIRSQQRKQEAWDEIDGERRAIRRAVHPFAVVLHHESAELPAEVVQQGLQRGEQPGLARFAQPQLPVYDLGVGLAPLAPPTLHAALRVQLPEAEGEFASDVLLLDGLALQQPGNDGQDLPW